MSDHIPVPYGLSEQEKTEFLFRETARLQAAAEEQRKAQGQGDGAITMQPSHPIPIPRIKPPRAATGSLADELVTWKSFLVVGAAIGIVTYAGWWNDADAGKAILTLLTAACIVSNRVLRLTMGCAVLFAVLTGLCVIGLATGYVKMSAIYPTKGGSISLGSKAKPSQRHAHKQAGIH